MCAQQLSLLTPPGQAEAPSVQCCAGGRGGNGGRGGGSGSQQAGTKVPSAASSF